MSKEIKTTLELMDVCRSVGLWYVGSFMLEMLMKRSEWENEDTKSDFVAYMHHEYNCDSNISGTRTRVNGMIRISDSRNVEEALGLVLAANDAKLGCDQSKENARVVLELIKDGKLKV